MLNVFRRTLFVHFGMALFSKSNCLPKRVSHVCVSPQSSPRFMFWLGDSDACALVAWAAATSVVFGRRWAYRWLGRA
jgi:hypothetical protein